MASSAIHENKVCSAEKGDNHQQAPAWVIDSAVSSHMSTKRELFTEFKKLASPKDVSLGDGHMVRAVGTGTVHLEIDTSRRSTRFVLLKGFLRVVNKF